MKIEITREEYLLLLDMLYMATWVLDAHTYGGQHDETEPFHALEQKMLGLAEEFGVTDEWVEWADDLEAYLHTLKYEEERSVLNHILQFEEDTFWSELTDRLARRDLTEEYGRDLEEIDPDEWYPPYENLVQSYLEEFESHGLMTLRIR